MPGLAMFGVGNIGTAGRFRKSEVRAGSRNGPALKENEYGNQDIQADHTDVAVSDVARDRRSDGPEAAQAAGHDAQADWRAAQLGRPDHSSSRRRAQAEAPPDRLQARKVRRAGQSG